MTVLKRRHVLRFTLTLALLGGFALRPAASGAQLSLSGVDGTTAQASPRIALGEVSPAFTFERTEYQTGGTGLRNQASGGITINGVTGRSRAAFLYWAIITQGPAGSAQSKMTVRRLTPNQTSFAPVQGVVAGTGDSPCWPGDTITVLRGRVPTSVANGNGFYQVSISPGSTSSVKGHDPWEGARTPPEIEGASLVIFYEAGRTTSVYDEGLAGHTFSSSLTYTLVLPAPAGQQTDWDDIGADGQYGSSRRADPGIGSETTEINGVAVAGPGSDSNDSDWNGKDSLPLPSLWDTSGHDVSEAVRQGSGSLSVSVMANGDCLTPVANIVHT